MRFALLCEKYGLDCTFYWPVDFITLSLEKGWEPITPQAETYISRNFEIGSHGVTHRYLTRISLEDARSEVFDSKQMLENKYDQNITKFCYPRGYTNEKVKQFIKQAGYDYARSTVIGHIGEPTDSLFAETSVHMGCPVRSEYKGTDWLSYATKLLEQAKHENKDFYAWGHSWEFTRYNEWKNVEKFLKEVKR